MIDPVSTASGTIRYPVDPEHWRLRAAVFGAFFVTAILVMVITSASGGFSLLGLIVGMLLGYVAALITERALRGRWHSARALEVAADGVRLLKSGVVEQEISLASAVTPLRWKFRVSRRARVPKGWWMYALSLSAPDHQLTVFTFLPPKDEETWARASQFTRLLNKKERSKAGPAPQSLRQAGEERRLREAEDFRWLAGAEMLPNDFKDLLDRLDRQFHEWSPLSS